MSSTKLIVLKSKELIYTAILVALIVVFIIIIITMFKRSDTHGSAGDDATKTASAPMSSNPETAYMRHVILPEHTQPPLFSEKILFPLW